MWEKSLEITRRRNKNNDIFGVYPDPANFIFVAPFPKSSYLVTPNMLNPDHKANSS